MSHRAKLEHRNLTYCEDNASVWDKSYFECVGDTIFLNPTRGLRKLSYLSVNSVSSTVFIYYHPHWSVFIFICSKGHNEKGQKTLKDRKKRLKIINIYSNFLHLALFSLFPSFNCEQMQVGSE